MQKARLSLKERIVVLLVGLLIFSLVLSVAGFVASYDTRRKLAAFASDGHTVTATITNKSISNVAQNHEFWLYVHTVTQEVSQYAYDGDAGGCHQSEPDRPCTSPLRRVNPRALAGGLFELRDARGRRNELTDQPDRPAT